MKSESRENVDQHALAKFQLANHILLYQNYLIVSISCCVVLIFPWGLGALQYKIEKLLLPMCVCL